MICCPAWKIYHLTHSHSEYFCRTNRRANHVPLPSCLPLKRACFKKLLFCSSFSMHSGRLRWCRPQEVNFAFRCLSSLSLDRLTERPSLRFLRISTPDSPPSNLYCGTVRCVKSMYPRRMSRLLIRIIIIILIDAPVYFGE